MSNMSVRKTMTLAMIALVTFTMTGCGSKLDGKYADANGATSIEFKSGKAYLDTMAGKVESDYEVNGDQITLKSNGQSMVFTRNSDGSLESPLGKMTKQ